jgi:transmembrane sensor
MIDLDRIRQHVSDTQPEARVQRMWIEIDAKKRPRPARRARYVALGLAFAMVVGSVLGLLLLRSDAGSITLEDGGTLPARIASASTVSLSDGSAITTGESSALEVLDNSGARVALALRSGRAEFDIEPDGPRTWRIECGGLAVEVVGTKFVVERGASGTTVMVERGAVLVRGPMVPDGVQRLGPGDRFESGVHVASSAERAPRSIEAPAPIEPSEPPRRSAPVPVEPEPEVLDWRAAAASGRHRDAFEAIGTSGIARESARAEDVSSLLALADVARLSGNPRSAVVPLSRIAWDFGEDPNAAGAAFTLGEIELETLGRPALAERAYSRSIALGLPEPLRETAHARRVEACARTGVSLAEAASAYRERYPDGRYTARVDGWSPP